MEWNVAGADTIDVVVDNYYCEKETRQKVWRRTKKHKPGELVRKSSQERTWLSVV
jgi:hypothetical protein